MPSTLCLFFCCYVVWPPLWLALFSIFLHKVAEKVTSAKSLALAIFEGDGTFSYKTQKSFDWLILNQASIPGSVTIGVRTRIMCYCTWQNLGYVPIPQPSNGLWLVEKWCLKAKLFLFPLERGSGAGGGKITVSTLGDKDQRDLKCSFQIYTYCFFYLHFWPQNKVLFRVKI